MPRLNTAVLAFCVAVTGLRAAGSSADEVRVGSKAFTESVVLAEVATQLGRSAGVNVAHRKQLGGTRILWGALRRGEIDAYPEYTGTLIQEVLNDDRIKSDEQLDAALTRLGIGMTRSLGFNDTYALGMLDPVEAERGVHAISDLARHPEMRLGFSNEFISRTDGWPSLRARYGLTDDHVSGLDHDLAYRALAAHSIDVIDLYSTDAEIQFYGLRTLIDDRHVFPEYKAIFIYRKQLEVTQPRFVQAISRLQGAIQQPSMIGMNGRVKLTKISEERVAADFLAATFSISPDARETSRPARILLRTREHLTLVGISLAAAIAAAIPLGVLAFARPRLGQVILAAVAVVYTIPSLALLVFMIPILGIGPLPAIVALFLYGLLPIVRNTHAGLAGIAPGIRESAQVLGLTPMTRLLRIELPIAMPFILAGIKTSAVINVGTATLGALIGAGGYGQPILSGVRLADNRLILEGAAPAAVLALLVEGAFGLLGYWIVPRGLRLRDG